MNILILNTLYHPYGTGGAERSTQLLAEGLVDRGHDVFILCTMPESGWAIEEQGGVTVYYTGLKNIYWPYDKQENPTVLKPVWHAVDSLNPWMQKRVRTVLERVSPDILHTHNLGGFSVSAWRAADGESVPIVHTARDYSLLCPKNMFWKEANCTGRCCKCRAFTISRKRQSRRVDGFVGISDFVLRRHEAHEYFSEAKKRVIYNPVDIEEANTEEKKGKGGLKIGFLGRLSKRKGIRRMIKSVDFYESDVKMYVGGVGDENYEKKVKKEAKKKPVTFLGFVDPTSFFEKVDVLIVPSVWHEPFGRVVIEAYAHSVPVIAAERGGLPEIVRDGTTGFTYDPDNPKALNERIEAFRRQENLVQRMGEKARSEAGKYDVRTHVEEYNKFYNEVVG
ncbi:glycosyltransferase family 4 protein [Salinibacter sp.]|uniref:glycosyltransferase family 4 protein n=1 Tax=Salinibacter sp. TaxID=2065818 RepID=UPI0021E766D0|nr:glycosyltransferase family 4 protein [Salinibacter sp.]